MNYLGAVNVGLGKAAYALPDYPVANGSGYSFARNNLRPSLQQTARVAGASTVTHYAQVQIGPAGFSEVVLAPTTTGDSTTNLAYGSRDASVDLIGSALAGQTIIHIQRFSPKIGFSAPYAPVAQYFPVGFGISPQVNIGTGIVGFSDFDQNKGYQSPGFLWYASALDDGFGIYAGVTEPGPQFKNAFKTTLQAATQLFLVDNAKVCMHSFGGINRLFLPVNGFHGNVLLPFQLTAYNPLGTSLLNIPGIIQFGQAALDTAFLDTSKYSISLWRGGFVVVMDCGGLGPTGQKYEVAVCNETMTNYWLIQFRAKDSDTFQALNRASGRWDIKIDVDGILYFSSQNVADRLLVFNTFNFTFDFPRVQATMPAISLPCFNPCLPTDLSRGLYGD